MKKIGVDIGGTSIKGILIDGDAIVKAKETPTNGKLGREAIKEGLFSIIDGLMDADVCLVGVSSAGNIDPYTGVCVYATDNLKGWTGYDIKSEIQNKYGVECIVDNDAICALKAEMSVHADVKDAVMITFGTGIGGAVLSGGKIIRGVNFDGGRLGHLVLVPNGRPCNCGKKGCVETYLSCTALKKEADAIIDGLEGVKELFDLYRQGDEKAIAILKEFAFYLNIFLGNIRTAYSPQIIIIGGAMSNSNDVLTELIEDTSDIVYTKNRNNAGALGAVKTIY